MNNVFCPRCCKVSAIEQDGPTLTCTSCEESFTLAEISAIVQHWSPAGKLLARVISSYDEYMADEEAMYPDDLIDVIIAAKRELAG